MILSLAAVNGKQILLIYQDYTGTNAHLPPFCNPITAPMSEQQSSARGTSSSIRDIRVRHKILYIAQVLLLWCLGEVISYSFHLEELEWLLNRQKGTGIYF